MERLPPVDWHELATKSDLALLKDDLAALEERIDAKFEVVAAKFTELRGEMKFGFARQLYFTLVGMAALVTPVYIALYTGAGG